MYTSWMKHLMFLWPVCVVVLCERTKDKMYTSIEANAYCFRRLNGTHQFGCTSSKSGNVGVIHCIERYQDIHWLLYEANAGPYMGVIKPELFYQEHDYIIKLKDSGKMSGFVLVASNQTENFNFSSDDTCPNRYSGLNECTDQNPWNPGGKSLLLVDWGFPIIYLDSQSSIDDIYKCFHEYNNKSRETQNERPLCSLEIKSHMLAAVDSQTCIRRSKIYANLTPVKYCDPLGDRNIISNLNPSHSSQTQIVFTTRVDTTTLFDGLMPGVISPVTSLVTFLTTATLLKKMVPSVDNQTNIYFVLLNGESYDYIGSSRLLYDIKKGQSKLLTNKIKLIIELDQITSTDVYIHRRNLTDSSQISSFIAKAQQEGVENGVNISDSVGPLPPASLQMFIKEEPSLDGIVISSYNRSYLTSVYHSIFDNATNIGYKYRNGTTEDGGIQGIIANVSLTLAKTICMFYYNDTCNKNADVDLPSLSTQVDELLHCYIDTLNCSIFNEVTNGQVLSDKSVPLYVGVNGYNNSITTLTGFTLAYYTGDYLDGVNESTCNSKPDDNEYQYIWMKGSNTSNSGVCVQTSLNFTLAVSPAFDIEDYDWQSNRYSTWTESIWREFSSRIFLKPPQSHEILTVVIGSLVFIISLFVVYFFQTRAHVIFNNNILATAGC